mgnify:FL=1
MEFYSKVPLVADWPTAGISAIIRGQILRHLSKGDVLFRQGEEADSIFFIKSGEIEVIRVALWPYYL